MIRRRFLSLLALLSFAGAPAAATAAPQNGLLPGRVDLLLRMHRIHALRRAIDACDRELDAIRARYEFKALPGGPTFSAEWFHEANPHYQRAHELENLLEELEREPLDTMTGDPEVRPGGVLEEFLRLGVLSVNQVRQLEHRA